MKLVPEEDYILMSAWCQTLVDGICYLIDGFSGQASKTMRDASKNLPPEIRNKIPAINNASSKPESKSESSQSSTNASTASKTTPQQPDANRSPTQLFKNPQADKAVRSVYADYRLRQYEKSGFLEQCVKQREERLGPK